MVIYGNNNRGGNIFDDPDLAAKLNDVKKEILKRRQAKGEVDDKELLRKLRDTEVPIFLFST